MLDTAQRIEEATTSRACDEAQTLTTDLRGLVGELPEETDPEIVDALDQMVSRIDEELDAECVEEGTTDTEETPETTETTVEPETTTSVPTETTTTTEPPPEEEDEEAPPTGPPGEGGGEGPPVTPPGQSGGAPTGGTEGDD
jgi:hypothetical protein